MRLRDGRYVGHFHPDEPGLWLVIPFGADHSMPSASATANGGLTVLSTLMLLAAAGTCTWLALRWMRVRALRR